jgi:hypothetical protein
MKRIRIGDWVDAGIHFLTLGYGLRISSFIAIKLLKLNSCGCCERKQWLNRLTNPNFDGKCNDVKLF